MARRYTPTIVHEADNWTHQAFACFPAEVLAERITALATALNDTEVKLTKAQRDALNKQGQVMEDALAERKRNDAMATFRLARQ